jgi:hypothetical protein
VIQFSSSSKDRFRHYRQPDYRIKVMARISTAQRKKAKQKESETEARIQEASRALTDKKFRHISQAARHFNVPYDTLRRRHQRRTQPHALAHTKQQLLNPAQEDVLCDWAKYMGTEGQPMSKNMLRVTVGDMSERLQNQSKETGTRQLPGAKWVYSLIERRQDLKLKRPTGLDPLRAQCFNPNSVNGHFQLLGDLLRDKGIPWENVYNMDEKGLQLGGGRKLDGTRYLYSSEQRVCVKTQKASLELVTAIECVAADGAILDPCLVFPGTSVLHEGYFEEEGVL